MTGVGPRSRTCSEAFTAVLSQPYRTLSEERGRVILSRGFETLILRGSKLIFPLIGIQDKTQVGLESLENPSPFSNEPEKEDKNCCKYEHSIQD